MPASAHNIKEVSIDQQPGWPIYVFIVGVASDVEVCEVEALFIELASRTQVRQLSRGALVSYAVQMPPNEPELITEVEDYLHKYYGFVKVYASFDRFIWRIVCDLAADTGSTTFRIPVCNICGNIEPFPATVVNLSDESGRSVKRRSYCRRCTADASAADSKEFVRSLLQADQSGLAALAHAQFARKRGRRRILRFAIGR